MKYITDIKITRLNNNTIKVELHDRLFTNNYRFINFQLINVGSLFETIFVKSLDESIELLKCLGLSTNIQNQDEFIEQMGNFKNSYYVIASELAGN